MLRPRQTVCVGAVPERTEFRVDRHVAPARVRVMWTPSNGSTALATLGRRRGLCITSNWLRPLLGSHSPACLQAPAPGAQRLGSGLKGTVIRGEGSRCIGLCRICCFEIDRREALDRVNLAVPASVVLHRLLHWLRHGYKLWRKETPIQVSGARR